MNNYGIESKKYYELRDDVELPKYQRRLVWSEKQKKNFIKSIEEGYPFGSLLLYKYKDEDGFSKDKYSLIDGLQRFSTLKHFEENKHEYFDFEEVIEEEFCEILGEIKSVSERSAVKKEYYNIIKKAFSGPEINELELAEELQNVKITHFDVKYFFNHYKNIAKKLKNYINLDELIIPYVIFKGDTSQLAEVFQRLNQGGVKLSKYQVFASQWSEATVKLNNDLINTRLLQFNADRYTKLNEEREGIEISDYDEDKFLEKKEINIAELCYSLGKLIIEESEVFYSGNESEDVANELGYATMAIILGIENNKLARIVDYKKYFSDPEDIEKNFQAVVSVYKEVNDVFKPYLRKPGKKKNEYFNSEITNFMYLSYFASIWAQRYTIDGTFRLEEKSGSKQHVDKIKNNMIKYYIYDNVRKYWSATGDKKLNEIYVGEGTSDRYLNELDEVVFHQEIDSWSKEELAKNSIQIGKLVKLLIIIDSNARHIYEDDEDNNFDFEHIIVKDYVKKLQTKKIGTIPGGHLGNVCLLTSYENRKKQNTTLYDHAAKQTSVILDKEKLEMIDYPNEKQLEFVNNLENEKAVRLSNNLIESRSKAFINSFVKALYN